MHISFIIEKDGSVDHYDVLGIVPNGVKEAIIAAVKQSRNWTQVRLYGVPLKTQIILPLSITKGYIEDKTIDTRVNLYAGIPTYKEDIYYRDEIKYYERILPGD